LRRTILLVLLLGGLLTPIGQSTVRAGEPRTETWLSWHSDPEVMSEDREDFFFTESNADLSVQGSETYISVDVDTPDEEDEDIWFEVRPKAGGKLAEGNFVNALSSRADDSTPMLDSPGGCYAVGWFDIKHYEYDTGGLKSLWLTFETVCNYGRLRTIGELKFNVPKQRGTGDFMAGMSHVFWSGLQLGSNPAAIPVTVTSQSKQPQDSPVFRDAYLTGRDPDKFEIMSKNCRNVLLAEGVTCQVWVDFDQARPGHKEAVLVLNFSDKEIEILLSAQVLPGVVGFAAESDPGDYIVEGRSWSVTPPLGYVTVDAAGKAGVKSLHAYVFGDDWVDWSLDFEAPSDETLSASATYRGARRYPFNEGRPGLDVSGWGRGCNKLRGWFRVNELVATKKGVVRSAAVDFVQHCDGDKAAFRGSLLYHVAKDLLPPPLVEKVAMDVSPNSRDLAKVRWQTPPQREVDRVVVRYLAGKKPPKLPQSGLLSEYTGRHRAKVPMEPGKPISVSVFTVDHAGNVSRAASITGFPAPE
jgi:hypothetical protein